MEICYFASPLQTCSEQLLSVIEGNLDCWIKRNRDFITIIFNNFKNKIAKIKGKLF